MIYDISIPLSDKTVVWPGDPAISITEKLSISKGDTVNVGEFKMGMHSGTHIDAPVHFIDGAETINDIDLSICRGICTVIQTQEDQITGDFLKDNCKAGVKRLLIKTPNSKLWEDNHTVFNKNFAALTKEAAQFIVNNKIELVGIDYLSIESFYSEPGNPVHNILLQNRVVILEGLNLSKLPPGDYKLTALPLKIEKANGSPVRAILEEL
jgi:arylformamidase